MLKLERVLDVSTMADQARRLNIEAEVRRLTSNIRFDRQMTLLTPEAKQQLRDFSNSDLLRVNFTAYSILVIFPFSFLCILCLAAVYLKMIESLLLFFWLSYPFPSLLLYSWNRTLRRSICWRWQPF